MVSSAVDASLAAIFYAITLLIIFSLFGCYIHDVYIKSRRGDYFSNPSVTTTSTTNTDTTTTTTNRNTLPPDLMLQLCTMTEFDEPLIGTICTRDEVVTVVVGCATGTTATLCTSHQTNHITTKTNTTVAIFGNNVIIPFDNNDTNNNAKEYYASSCPICLNEYVLNDTVFRNDPNKCRHIFHTECILTWIQQQQRNHIAAKRLLAAAAVPPPECPCCRSHLAVTMTTRHHNDLERTATTSCTTTNTTTDRTTVFDC